MAEWLMLLTSLSFATMGECGLNMNDILNVNYLPGTLLLDNLMIDDDRNINKSSANNKTPGKWKDAFHTMDFHRKMMNEYLCRSYVAEQILSDMDSGRAYDRLGSPADSSTLTPKQKKIDLSAIKENMLADPGSSHYKNWLSRTTTLEDIYRHYEDMDAEEDGSHDDGHSSVAEYDGEVTGYAVHKPMPMPTYGMPVKTGYSGHSASGHGSSYGGGGSGHGGGSSGSSGYGSGGGTGHSSSGSSGSGGGYSYHPSHKSDKGMALKDLFELALTALAFLAFGLFKLNVIMCIFGNGGSMSTTAAAEAVSAAPMMGKIASRKARSLPLGISTPDVLNVMSQRVLKSIEVFLAIQQDDGECLRLTLCDNNRFSRRLSGADRIWLPVWSLGLSWIAGRFSPSQHASAAMLEFLRASVLGLGNSECEQLYSRCSLEKIANSRTERSKRRRKRRHGDPGDY